MKLSAKPISSPGRADKFPPPLMRFLRSNVGSKSRGRSRSSPMFVRKKSNAAAAAAVETQEPSSPKVTCMGQVRVRRSSSVASSRGPGRSCRAGSAPTRKPRIRSALFCGVNGKTKPKKKSSSSSCGQLWRKWVPSFVSCRKGRVEEDPPKAQIHVEEEVQSFRSDEEEEEREEAEFERKAKAFAASCSSSPPKNALLLTRCRSAPYRSSSLASRFWGSPNRAEEKEETEQEQSIELENRENERPTSETESISDQESRTEQQDEQKIEFFKGLERSIRERTHKSPSIEEEEEESKEEPLILTRCKSEPARTAAVFAIN